MQIVEVLVSDDSPVVISMHSLKGACMVLDESLMLDFVHKPIPRIICSRALYQPTSDALSSAPQLFSKASE
ncbi:hypothetical protein JM78_29820 [Burkholderia pyrrocinia]|nr:hypothetical protein JM78_29820 [Burkholderia pyrrocinia]